MKKRLVTIATLLGAVAAWLIACGDSDNGGGASPSLEAGVSDAADASSVLPDAAADPDARAPVPDGGLPAGWLYTRPNDNKIYQSNGTSGAAWMARGVNVDDVFLCGYNAGFWMSNPDGEQALTGMLTSLFTDWKPTLVRLSLSMNSYPPYQISWVNDTQQYATRMKRIISAIGAHPSTYVLLALRSEASMVNAQGQACANGGDDAICIPTNATDAVYKALVGAFKDAPYVIFGVSNEPGGNGATDPQIAAAMSHAVGVIRAEEDALGVPHHLVSVQGNVWTSKIGFYDATPIAFDNVVYEYHAYPPNAADYTQTHIPVIIGEYGPSNGDTSFATAFYADVEAKQIPNIAWDMNSYNDCAPDLAQVTHTTSITASAWGQVVKAYLNAH